MSLYATTVIPSYDGLGGIETLSRIIKDSSLVAHAIYDEESKATVAILKTEGSDLVLRRIAESLEKFDVPVITSHSLLDAIDKAKKFAHNRELVEITNYRLEDTATF